MRGDLTIIDPHGLKLHSIVGLKRRLELTPQLEALEAPAEPSPKRPAVGDESASEGVSTGRSRRARAVVNYSEQAMTPRLGDLILKAVAKAESERGGASLAEIAEEARASFWSR